MCAKCGPKMDSDVNCSPLAIHIPFLCHEILWEDLNHHYQFGNAKRKLCQLQILSLLTIWCDQSINQSINRLTSCSMIAWVRRSHAPANATTHGQQPLTVPNVISTINTQRISGKQKNLHPDALPIIVWSLIFFTGCWFIYCVTTRFTELVGYYICFYPDSLNENWSKKISKPKIKRDGSG